eukprot:scaffold74948_cov17-Tisochrysis_lutea.AAC.1
MHPPHGTPRSAAQLYALSNRCNVVPECHVFCTVAPELCVFSIESTSRNPPHGPPRSASQVYVLGNRTVVTKRPSLGDKYLDKEARGKGVMHLPRISCKADYCPPGTNQAAHQLAASVSCDMDEFCEAPPEWITHTLVRCLRDGRGFLVGWMAPGASMPRVLGGFGGTWCKHAL